MKGTGFFRRIRYRTLRGIRRNSSTILTCIGAAGVVGTAIMAVRATPKAIALLEDAELDKGDDLTKLEKVRIAAPVYIPTAVMGTYTIVCIFGANVLNQKQQASLMSAYALLDSSYKDYQNKVKELYGEDTDNEIKDAISRDKYAKNPCVPTEGKLLWYELYRDEFFELTEKEVMDAEYYTNRNFILRGETNLNEFYEFLGLEPTDAGCELGWDLYSGEAFYGNSWIDFEHHLVTSDDGVDYYRIEYPFPPHAAIPEDE